MQANALQTLALYIVLKQMLASPAEAARIGASLSLAPFRELHAGMAVGEPVNFTEFDAALAQGVRALAAGAHAEALVLLRAAATVFVRLIDEGHHPAAINLATHYLAEIPRATPWRLDFLLPLAAGLLAYGRDGAIPGHAHQARCDLHNQTNGRLNEFAGWLMSALRPLVALPDGGLLDLTDPARRHAIGATLAQDGYCRLDQRLPDTTLRRIHDFALTAIGSYDLPRAAAPRAPGPVRFDDPTIDGLNFDTEQSLRCRALQEVIADPSLLTLVQDALGCAPVLARVGLRWSLPSLNPPSIDIAQYYHYDMDYFRFIKIFIYITDVSATDGPHCYVAGSHLAGTKPMDLLSRGYVRIPDDDIARFYPATAIRQVTGPAGTILVGNTRCWHKGAKPTGRPRLMVTLVFGDTFACGTDDLRFTPPADCAPSLQAMIARHPDIYERFRPARPA
jgi:hypothetical protein